MEAVALQMCSTFYERLDIPFDPSFIKQILQAIFTILHFYRNNTQAKLIPVSVIKPVHLFFANFMIKQSSQDLVNACN